MSGNLCREAIIEGISVPVGTSEEDVLRKAAQKLKKCGLPDKGVRFRICKKSVDARKREEIRLVYSVMAVFPEGRAFSEEKLTQAGCKPHVSLSLGVTRGHTPLTARPLVVGMGPAGLFCAYLLAREGYAPILIDRGDSVTDRVKAVEGFYTEGRLDTESNIQFGAGGAGTFSDGKLLTRINDARCSFVLETLRDMGAPEDITLQAKPHVGTDVLRVVVQNMLDAIRELGGEVIYRCRFDGYDRHADGSFTAKTTKGDIPCGIIVLAPGHSARDTYKMLLEKQMMLQSARNADLVFTGSAFINQDGNPKDWVLHVPDTISYRKLLKQNLISNSSVLVRKERFLACECLCGGLHEDFVCWLRMLKDGALACGIDEPLLIYRLTPTSKSGNKLKAAKMNWHAYRTAGLSIPEAAYYMGFYTINSLLKYRHLK
jgi:hypothetical protein